MSQNGIYNNQKKKIANRKRDLKTKKSIGIKQQYINNS